MQLNNLEEETTTFLLGHPRKQDTEGTSTLSNTNTSYSGPDTPHGTAHQHAIVSVDEDEVGEEASARRNDAKH